MAQIRLTKNELRLQQEKLKQLQRYLPTLQLKKTLLQTEVNQIAAEVATHKATLESLHAKTEEFSALLSGSFLQQLHENLHVDQVLATSENIAGVEVPIFENVLFRKEEYTLFNTPLWWDSAIEKLQDLIRAKERVLVTERKLKILQKELRDVSIRVNLFEKILIPRTEANIKKIRIFLGDQELAAVAQAKVAKEKILIRKSAEEEDL